MILYLISAFYAFRRYKSSLYSFLWIYYAIFATAGVFIVATGIYTDRFYDKSFNHNVTIIPYIYNYICIFLILFPFRKVSINKNSLGIGVRLNKKRINNLFNIICFLFAIYLFLNIISLNEYSKYSLLERREMSVSGESLISRQNNFILWFILYIYGILYNAIFPFLIIFILAFYEKHVISGRKMALVIILYFLPPFLSNLMSSNRSGLFWLILNASFYFFLFEKVMSRRLKRMIFKVLISILVPVVILLTLITQVRYADSKISSETGVFSYFGESFPNLGYFIYNGVYHHTYGARLFPDYVQLISGYVPTVDGGLEGYHVFWRWYTGVPIEVFKTLFGDLYIEFDTLGAIAFVLAISIVMTIFVKRSKHIYTRLAVLSFYYAFCLNAVLDYGLAYGRMMVPRLILAILLFGFFWRKYLGLGNA